jgi:histidinol-phosphate phosphatase family protein
MKKAVFFDRDGTLIVDRAYLNDPDAIEYLPNVFAPLKRLRDAGFYFVVVTNQSGVPRGLVTLKNLAEIHRRIRFSFAEHGVDFLDFYFAPYHTDHDHLFRKPNPGMLLQAAQEYHIDLGRSWMIGDKMTDVEAGHRAGTKTVLFNSPDGPDVGGFAPPCTVLKTMSDVADFILSNECDRE